MSGTRLFWKLYPSYLLITVLSLLVAGWFVSGTLREFHTDQVSGDLEAKARLIGYILPSESISLANGHGIEGYCKKMGKLISTRITVMLPSGKVIDDSHKDPKTMDNHGDRPEMLEALAGRVGRSIRHSHTLQTDMMYVALPVEKKGRTIAVVRTSMPLSAIDAPLGNIRTKIAVGSLVSALLAGILCLMVSRRISRPLEELTDGAERYSRGEMGRRPFLPRSASREFHMLENAMNRMALEREKRIETVIRQRNQLEAILSSMSDGVIAVDQEGRVVMMNDSAARMLDSSLPAAQDCLIEETVRNPALQDLIREVLSTGEGIQREITLHRGDETVLQAHAVPLHSTNETDMAGALVVLTDVTKLRQVDRMRKDFVANVSHELRTPITAVKGFAETLTDGTPHDPETVSRFLSIISSHADRMEKIIEDLLTLSRLERTGSEDDVEFDLVELDDTVHRAIEACRLNAEKNSITIQTILPRPVMIRANSHLLEQALVNLIDNAVKYSDNGGCIAVETEQVDHGVLIFVKDEGCGIAGEHLSRIFERFYRVDKARSRKLGGTGLGLAIVKHVAHMHGGRVEVRSTPGQGSVFSIYLPGTGGPLR